LKTLRDEIDGVRRDLDESKRDLVSSWNNNEFITKLLEQERADHKFKMAHEIKRYRNVKVALKDRIIKLKSKLSKRTTKKLEDSPVEHDNQLLHKRKHSQLGKVNLNSKKGNYTNLVNPNM